MSVLETATAAAGAATTKTRERKKRSTLAVNGKHYSQMDRIGRGGSSAVYRVMAENFKMLALKRVKLEDADEAAVRGYKGEIDLLQKLKNVERVVRLYDWEVDEQRQVLSVVSNASSEIILVAFQTDLPSSWKLESLIWHA
jgi:serine/threonine-protein kinase TTK/MPS1